MTQKKKFVDLVHRIFTINTKKNNTLIMFKQVFFFFQCPTKHITRDHWHHHTNELSVVIAYIRSWMMLLHTHVLHFIYRVIGISIESQAFRHLLTTSTTLIAPQSEIDFCLNILNSHTHTLSEFRVVDSVIVMACFFFISFILLLLLITTYILHLQQMNK